MAAKKSEGVLVKVYLAEAVHRRLKAQAAYTGRQIGEEAAQILDKSLPVNVYVTVEKDTTPPTQITVSTREAKKPRAKRGSGK